MTLRLHNTLGGRVETFVPIDPPRVTFYTCGPTVYDFAHIGNFRSFLAADVLRRWLQSPLCERVDARGEPAGAFGYDVTHVMNITDVGHMVDDAAADGGGEDKMEAARRRLLEDKKSGRLPEGVGLDADDPYAIAAFYADAFVDDARTLGMRVVEEAADRPELLPRPTRVVPQMLEMVEDLIAKGHAYIADDGVAYFDTGTFADYGRLSGNTPETIRSGAGGRVAATTQAVKRHPADFMLWKPDPAHLMRWDPAAELGRDSDLGEGYPGWHLECSVMARELLGDEIDLHSGGEDNIFPHHECEIAQSRCATGRGHFARFWFHPRFLMVEGAKMSKSAGTFFTVRDLLGKGFAPAAIRLELIKTHYRSNANFTEQGLTDSARQAQRWRAFLGKADASGEAGSRNDAVARAFADAMNDDLNVSGAIGALNTWINDTPAPTRADAALMREIDGVLGVLSLGEADTAGGGDDDAAIEALVRKRDEARASKDWDESDRLRDELAAMGVEVKDSKDGATWQRVAKL
jgi:cysteinyl-tRNA synthetase